MPAVAPFYLKNDRRRGLLRVFSGPAVERNHSVPIPAMFHPVESSVSFPKQEEKIIASGGGANLRKVAGRPARRPGVRFLRGPAHGQRLPHPGHCLTRAIKDLFPRYRTMRGYRCDRKAGWDTHGLPVEVEVCKELGIHSKEEIEAFGVEPFIRRCQESVFRYMRQWEQLTERLGFWIHFDNAYVTYHQSYVESVWWALKSLFDRGLLYQGYKIVWWWAQGGTALVPARWARAIARWPTPASTCVSRWSIRRRNLAKNADLLVWTTTPWTLPANQFVAVNPTIRILPDCRAERANRRLIVAETCSRSSKNCRDPLKSPPTKAPIDASRNRIEVAGQPAWVPIDTFLGNELAACDRSPFDYRLVRKEWGEYVSREWKDGRERPHEESVGRPARSNTWRSNR